MTKSPDYSILEQQRTDRWVATPMARFGFAQPYGTVNVMVALPESPVVALVAVTVIV